jgi:DNA-binding SARP family transcriptional activator
MQSTIHISLTGPFEVSTTTDTTDTADTPDTSGTGAAGRPVDIRGVKPRQVLALLALSAGEMVSKEQLAEGLWGATPPASWLATVESYVCVLRRTLEGTTGGSVILTARGGYVLDPRSVDIDLHRSIESARAALDTDEPRTAAHHVDAMLAAVRGTVLADEPYAAWAETARTRLRAAVVTATTHAARLALDGGDTTQARRLADVALDWDPLCEPALRVTMRARTVDGRLNEALRLYQALADTLSEEMGCDPDPATREVYTEVLRAGGPDALSTPAEARVLIELLRQSLAASAVLRQLLSAEIEGLAREVRTGFAA